MGLLMRPGYTLLIASVASYIVSKFIGVVPLIGSTMAVMLFMFAMFAAVGGLWLVVAEWRTAKA